MNASTRQPAGMRAFIVVWIGQTVSLLGSGLTAFGVTIWESECKPVRRHAFGKSVSISV